MPDFVVSKKKLSAKEFPKRTLTYFDNGASDMA
jgi:hypothetical protein